MKLYDWVSGLLEDIFSSLGWAAIIVVIAFGIALVAGWIDFDSVAGWLRGLAP